MLHWTICLWLLLFTMGCFIEHYCVIWLTFRKRKLIVYKTTTSLAELMWILHHWKHLLVMRSTLIKPSIILTWWHHWHILVFLFIIRCRTIHKFLIIRWWCLEIILLILKLLYRVIRNVLVYMFVGIVIIILISIITSAWICIWNFYKFNTWLCIKVSKKY